MTSFGRPEGNRGHQSPGSAGSNEPASSGADAFRAWQAAERGRYSQSTSGSPEIGTAGGSSGPTAGGRSGAQGGGRTPHRQQVRGQSSSQKSSGGSGSPQGKDGLQLDERQVQTLLEAYYPWALQKVRESDSRLGLMPKILNAKEWLDAPLDRAMRAEIGTEMHRQGISEKNDPEGFHSELQARLAAKMPDTAWREAVKEKLLRRLGSAPTRESLESDPIKHWSYVTKMLTSSVVAFSVAISAPWVCGAFELVNGVMVASVLGATFLNWRLCEIWHHRREANEFQNLDILFREARKAETLERKLAFTGALYDVVSKHGLQKPVLGKLFPEFAEKFDWRGIERFEKLSSSLQKLQQAGRFVAEELVRTGTSVETERGVDQRFDQKLTDFENDLKEIKNHWAAYPDDALSVAKLGWVGGIVYTAYTVASFFAEAGF